VSLRRVGEAWWVHGPWGDVEVVERSPFPSPPVEEASGSLHAPMPGSVVSVEVAVGDAVRKGQTLVVLEAMKMEHPIGSPQDGVVGEVLVSPGDQVERGSLLVVVE
jgi:propionyl-CoA carboxylase alpha chain